MKQYELKPNGSQKSFYGKATVIINKAGDSVLKSYNTIVCGIIGGRFVRFWDGYSATTAKHIHAFRLANGLQGVCKKEWDALPVEAYNWIEFEILDGGKIVAAK